jgi:GT2 family glycosyltransferase
MKISLIVATMDRVAPLRLLFETLRRQSCRDFEILLADQNPETLLAPLLEEFKDLSVKRFLLKPCGASGARNAMLPHASGEIIAFPDDDCFYEPGAVAETLRFFERRPEAGGVMADWLPPGGQFPSQGEDSGPLALREAFFKSETYVQFFRREVCEKLGGFDNELGPGEGRPYGCGEDTDYVLRAIEAGYEVRRCPAIKVRHPAPDLANLNAAKAFNYGIGRMKLLRKHGMPLWFKLANAFYPFARMPLEGPARFRYRLAMGRGRLKGLLDDLTGRR